MNDKLMLLEFLKENPTATNTDIAEFMGINMNYAKSLVSKLKKAKVLKITNNHIGDRVITVLTNEIYKKRQNSINPEEVAINKEMVRKMTVKVLETTIEEKNADRIISLGNLFVRLYDRL